MTAQTPNPNTNYDLLCEVLPAPVVEAVELCALPHSVDDGLGYQILHDHVKLNGTARAIWTEVKHLPFVYPYEGKQWRFDDPARAYFVARLERRNGLYLKLHHYLKDHFEEERKRIADGSAPQARELEWRIAYHLAPVFPDEAVERLSALGEQAVQANRLSDVKGVIDLFEEQDRWLSPYQVERAYFEGRYAYAKGDHPVAEDRFRLVWEQGRPVQMKAIAGHLLGRIVEKGGDWRWLKQAEGLYRESLAILRDVGDRRGQAIVLNTLGVVLVKLGRQDRLEEADGLYRESLEIRHDLGDRHGEAKVLNSLSVVLVKLGGQDRLIEAEGFCRKSLAILRDVGDRRGEAMVLNTLATVLVDLGRQARLEEAEGLYRRSLKIRESLENRLDVAMVLNGLGGVLVKLGGRDRLKEAEGLYRENLKIRESLENPLDVAKALINLAKVLVKFGGRGRREEAERLYRESLAIGKRIGLPRHETMALNPLARLAEDKGEIEQAIKYVKQIISIDEALGNNRFMNQNQDRLKRLRRKLPRGGGSDELPPNGS